MNTQKIKENRHEDLIGEYVEHEWEIEFDHVAVGCQGFIQKSVFSFLGRRLGYSKNENRKITPELQKAAENSSSFIRLKR